MKIAIIFTQCALQASSEASYLKSHLVSKSLSSYEESRQQSIQSSMQQIELNYTTSDLKNMIIFGRLLTDQS